MLQLNKIYEMDCLEGMKSIRDNSVDLIVTDPPYGVNFCSSAFYDDKNVFDVYKLWLAEMHRILKDHAHIYIFIPTMEVDKWVGAVKEYFDYNNLLSSQNFCTNRYIKNNFGFDLQLIIYASKGKAKRLNAVDWIPASDMWQKDPRNTTPKAYTYRYPSVIPSEYRANVKNNRSRKRVHPNEKNPELIKKLIEVSSKRGDLVVDPFVGGGSTAIVCAETKRLFLGFETNSEYFAIASEKFEAAKTVHKQILLKSRGTIR